MGLFCFFKSAHQSNVYDRFVSDRARRIQIILGIIKNTDAIQYFSPDTGCQKFYIVRIQHFTVARLSSIICFLSGRSFLISTICNFSIFIHWFMEIV